MFPSLPDDTAIARLHGLAKAQAAHLRREAIDDFWRGADAVFQRTLHTGQRAAQRSAARLQAALARRA